MLLEAVIVVVVDGDVVVVAAVVVVVYMNTHVVLRYFGKPVPHTLQLKVA